MSCTHPLKRFYTFYQSPLSVDLKKSPDRVSLRDDRKGIVTPYEVNHLELIDNKLVRKYDDEVSPDAKAVYSNYIEIPCGKCISCRLKRSKEWANRCMLELPYHEQSWFVTLTYSDEYVPFNTILDDYGNYYNSLTLRKEDLQKFFKRLRKNYKYDNHIKYYACGEYGDNPDATQRPHYHCIIFGLKLDDLKFYKTSRLGFSYYNSDFLSSIWPYGHVVIAEVSWETCAYTARYIMKKKYGYQANDYEVENKLPEFTTMSLNPAIGYEYFQENKDKIYDLDSISISTSNGAKKFKPPKYFDSKMSEDLEDAFKLREIRSVRQEVAELNMKHKLNQTDLDYLDYLEVEEDLLKSRVSKLYRKEV